MFNLTLKPIIQTYHLGDYLSFISDLFDAESVMTHASQGEVVLLNQSFIIEELPKKRSKLPLNFKLTLHQYTDLETILERAKFYYYRKGLKFEPSIHKVAPAQYELTLLDPDKRELKISCRPRPAIGSNITKQISYN